MKNERSRWDELLPLSPWLQGKKPNESSAKKLPESEEALTDKRRGREGRGEWEIEDLWEEVNAESEEKREIDGIEAKGEKHRAELSAIGEKKDKDSL